MNLSKKLFCSYDIYDAVFKIIFFHELYLFYIYVD